MSRAKIRRVADLELRRLLLALHAAPRGQRTSRQTALRDYVAQMLAKESA